MTEPDETTNKLLAHILDRLDGLDERVKTLAETSADACRLQVEQSQLNMEWVEKASNDIHNLVLAVREIQEKVPSDTAERLKLLERISLSQCVELVCGTCWRECGHDEEDENAPSHRILIDRFRDYPADLPEEAWDLIRENTGLKCECNHGREA